MQSSLTIATVLAIVVAICNATNVQQCKSGLPLPFRVDVDNCVEPPCKFPKGKVAEWKIIFDAPVDLDTIEPVVTAYLVGIPINYPLREADGCKELVGEECPLEEGQRVVYATGLEIKEEFPKITLPIEQTLHTYDEEGKKFAFTCFRIDISVVT